LKQEGRVVELTFREPVSITISQWIKPEDRDYIPTDTSGYRILKNIEKVVFVLEGRYGGHILTKSADIEGYGCWAIIKDGRADKIFDFSWVIDVGRAVLVEISKENSTVYLEMHPNATYSISRAYLTFDGLVYQVDENWKIKNAENVAGIGPGKPVDGKDHYCWVVRWYDPNPDMAINHTVYVYIDRDRRSCLSKKLANKVRK